MGWLRRRRNRRLRRVLVERAVAQARRFFSGDEVLVMEVRYDEHSGVLHGLRARKEEWRQGLRR